MCVLSPKIWFKKNKHKETIAEHSRYILSFLILNAWKLHAIRKSISYFAYFFLRFKFKNSVKSPFELIRILIFHKQKVRNSTILFIDRNIYSRNLCIRPKGNCKWNVNLQEYFFTFNHKEMLLIIYFHIKQESIMLNIFNYINYVYFTYKFIDYRIPHFRSLRNY